MGENDWPLFGMRVVFIDKNGKRVLNMDEADFVVNLDALDQMPIVSPAFVPGNIELEYEIPRHRFDAMFGSLFRPMMLRNGIVGISTDGNAQRKKQRKIKMRMAFEIIKRRMK